MITSQIAGYSPCGFQVQIGSHAFTFDHVYGSSGSPYSSVFKECVLPLIDALFHGYNATVLAYGQVLHSYLNAAITRFPLLLLFTFVLSSDI